MASQFHILTTRTTELPCPREGSETEGVLNYEALAYKHQKLKQQGAKKKRTANHHLYNKKQKEQYTNCLTTTEPEQLWGFKKIPNLTLRNGLKPLQLGTLLQLQSRFPSHKLQRTNLHWWWDEMEVSLDFPSSLVLFNFIKSLRIIVVLCTYHTKVFQGQLICLHSTLHSQSTIWVPSINNELQKKSLFLLSTQGISIWILKSIWIHWK